MIAPVKAIIGLTATSMLWAQVAPTVPTASIDTLGRLTLDGALGIAVVWLARTLMATIAASDAKLAALTASKDARIAEKDAQLMAMATKVTEVMVTVMEAVKELRGTVGELKTSFSDLPCAVREHQQGRA